MIQGTSGTLKYKNSQGRKTDIDLHYKDTAIPLNKYFWKVVHDVEKNEAIAFVGINDPHWDTTGIIFVHLKSRLFTEKNGILSLLKIDSNHSRS